MISSLVPALISAFKARRELALENVALRQQLAVIRRSVKRPRLSKVDRGFWVLLRRIWTDWESVLVIVKPETVILSIIIINPGLDSRARTALEHMLESVVSARGKVLRTNFSATSRVNASDQADSGCLSPLVSMVQSTDSRQCDYFRRRRRSVRDRSQARCVLVQQARCVLVQPQVATVVMIVADVCRLPDYAA